MRAAVPGERVGGRGPFPDHPALSASLRASWSSGSLTAAEEVTGRTIVKWTVCAGAAFGAGEGPVSVMAPGPVLGGDVTVCPPLIVSILSRCAFPLTSPR